LGKTDPEQGNILLPKAEIEDIHDFPEMSHLHFYFVSYFHWISL